MIAAPSVSDRALPVVDAAITASVLGMQAQALQGMALQQGWPLAVKAADDGRYLMANAAFAALMGRPVDEVTGRSDAELFEPVAVPALRAADQTALAQGGLFTSEHRFEHRGERRDFNVLRVAGQGAGRALVMSLWQDQAPARQREQQLAQALAQLEQLQNANEHLRREAGEQSLRDLASGLNTRAHFDDQMRRELDLSVREHREFALVHMSLDPAGARVAALGERAHTCICEAMGRLLRGNTRAMDASCRLDDRHFAVLLSGVGLATAHSRMEGLRRQCATQIVLLDGERLEFSVSMGVASFPHTAHGPDELVAACQSALAEARRRGGNTVALASIRFEPS
ncbi:sensor domain-containing diguanylate cyclase [Aquabacterium sp. OR-4]|uniref:sensor domain-containing diguanylate cyclase n=1 Tax=Aquabacterium sp. OR-4 TaxID=2978127 RepID=UPI0021B206BA|nr:diguanylate cyclase [Aquabacterium sp. OR-4]MDT7836138.1 diguanylate cyclase [Aquabacterium sp. OR-4]